MTKCQPGCPISPSSSSEGVRIIRRMLSKRARRRFIVRAAEYSAGLSIALLVCLLLFQPASEAVQDALLVHAIGGNETAVR